MQHVASSHLPRGASPPRSNVWPLQTLFCTVKLYGFILFGGIDVQFMMQASSWFALLKIKKKKKLLFLTHMMCQNEKLYHKQSVAIYALSWSERVSVPPSLRSSWFQDEVHRGGVFFPDPGSAMCVRSPKRADRHLWAVLRWLRALVSLLSFSWFVCCSTVKRVGSLLIGSRWTLKVNLKAHWITMWRVFLSLHCPLF